MYKYATDMAVRLCCGTLLAPTVHHHYSEGLVNLFNRVLNRNNSDLTYSEALLLQLFLLFEARLHAHFIGMQLFFASKKSFLSSFNITIIDFDCVQ